MVLHRNTEAETSRDNCCLDFKSRQCVIDRDTTTNSHQRVEDIGVLRTSSLNEAGHFGCACGVGSSNTGDFNAKTFKNRLGQHVECNLPRRVVTKNNGNLLDFLGFDLTEILGNEHCQTADNTGRSRCESECISSQELWRGQWVRNEHWLFAGKTVQQWSVSVQHGAGQHDRDLVISEHFLGTLLTIFFFGDDALCEFNRATTNTTEVVVDVPHCGVNTNGSFGEARCATFLVDVAHDIGLASGGASGASDVLNSMSQILGRNRRVCRSVSRSWSI